MTWLRVQKRTGWLVVAGVVLGSVVAVQYLASAQMAPKSRESKIDSATLEKKLDAVLSNQRTILQKLDAVMEELRIIKIRATR